MNEKLLASFSPSVQRALKAFAGSPAEAASFHNDVVKFAVALKIGIECMERTGAKNGGPLHTLCLAAVGASTALDCTQGLLRELFPELGVQNMSQPGPDVPPKNGSGPHDHIVKRFELLD